jgi:proteasome alpha subunit
VEIVVAEVGEQPEGDQIYRITFDGSVNDEPGFVAFGGQADQVSAVLKERYSPGMSLSEAFGAALAALTATGNGERTELAATQLEVAILDRTRDHRTFRRIRVARLEELIAEARSADAKTTPETDPPATGPAPSGSSAPSTGSPPSGGGSAPSGGGSTPSAGSEPPTGPDRGSTDRGGGVGGGDTTPPNPL